MFRELERMLRMWEEQGFSSTHTWVDRFQQLLGEGPRTSVTEQGGYVKVTVEAPGYRKKQQEWSMRVEDQTLFLKGIYEEQTSVRRTEGPHAYSAKHRSFVKAVPLPGPAERKPLQVRYEDGILTIVLKRKRNEDDPKSWIRLSP